MEENQRRKPSCKELLDANVSDCTVDELNELKDAINAEIAYQRTLDYRTEPGREDTPLITELQSQRAKVNAWLEKRKNEQGK